jgi:hypothetical protein
MTCKIYCTSYVRQIKAKINEKRCLFGVNIQEVNEHFMLIFNTARECKKDFLSSALKVLQKKAMLWHRFSGLIGFIQAIYQCFPSRGSIPV